MRSNYYKVCQVIVTLLMGVSFVLEIVNKELLDEIIPQDIMNSLFWLTLGLYIGFYLNSYTVRRTYMQNEKKM